MAISNEWTDPDDLEVGPGDIYERAPWGNAILGNQKFLYETPRVKLGRSNDLGNIDAGENRLIPFTAGALVDVGGWFNPSQSWTDAIVPRDGEYLITCNALWDPERGGERRMRLLRDGQAIRDNPSPSMPYAPHNLCTTAALAAGRALSIDVHHNDSDRQHAITGWTNPWRSVIFMVQWIGPMGVEE